MGFLGLASGRGIGVLFYAAQGGGGVPWCGLFFGWGGFPVRP